MQLLCCFSLETLENIRIEQLVKVTLVVAFGLLPQNVGRWQEVQVQWWRHREVVETLKPYLIQKNLFEIFALTGGGDTKTSGMSTHPITHTLAT